MRKLTRQQKAAISRTVTECFEKVDVDIERHSRICSICRRVAQPPPAFSLRTRFFGCPTLCVSQQSVGSVRSVASLNLERALHRG